MDLRPMFIHIGKSAVLEERRLQCDGSSTSEFDCCLVSTEPVPVFSSLKRLFGPMLPRLTLKVLHSIAEASLLDRVISSGKQLWKKGAVVLCLWHASPSLSHCVLCCGLPEVEDSTFSHRT